ncbi:MAG: chemotaxis protein CheC [Planctomycetota bacterium]
MHLSEEEIDALNETVNIGVGRAASSLSELIGSRISLRIPQIRVESSMPENNPEQRGMSVVQSFRGDVSGNALLVFPVESGQKLAAVLGGYEEGEAIADFELAGILSEIGNIVLNGVLGSLANAIDADLEYRVPEFYFKDSLPDLVDSKADDSSEVGSILIADTDFSVDDSDVHGSVVIAFRLGSLTSLLSRLLAIYA